MFLPLASNWIPAFSQVTFDTAVDLLLSDQHTQEMSEMSGSDRFLSKKEEN